MKCVQLTGVLAVLLGAALWPGDTAVDVAAAFAEQPAPQKTIPLSPVIRERCLQELQQGLKSAEFWPSMHAAEALTLAGHGDDVIAALQGRLDEQTDDQKRCGLAREMARAGKEQHVAELFRILASQESTGRVHAAESLYKLGQTGDGQSLQAAMRQGEPIALKLMAAAALGRSGDAAAMHVIRSSLQSDEDRARSLAAWILSRIGSADDIAALKKSMLRDSTEMAQTFHAAALACLGDADGRKQLGQMLNAQDPVARAMAAEFVGHCCGIEFQRDLIRMLDDAALDVRIRAAQSLIALSP